MLFYFDLLRLSGGPIKVLFILALDLSALWGYGEYRYYLQRIRFLCLCGLLAVLQ